MLLSPSEPLSFRVTYRTPIVDPSAFIWDFHLNLLEAIVAQLENKESYIGSSAGVLAMASLDTDQIIVQSACVIVLQQSHLPLIEEMALY